VLVTTGTGPSEAATAQVNIANVAPTVTPPPAAPPTTAGAGRARSFALGSFSDPGALDAPWTVTVNWGDGTPNTVFQRTALGALPAQSHTYATPGNRTVTVTVRDKDNGASAPATFAVTVDAAPQAVADSAEVLLGSSLLIDVLANDTGAGLTLTTVGPASRGSTAIEAGKVRYTAPAAGSPVGPATFSYTVTDRNGAISTAQVTVQVTTDSGVAPRSYLPFAFGQE
jgi:hypothetical protein